MFAVLLGLLTLSAQGSVMKLNGQFAGNDNEANVEAAILSATGVTIDLSLYDKSDENPVLTTVTGLGGKSGTWDVINDAVVISYVTVKASNFFTLYEYTPGENSGSWTTAGITNPGGQQPNLSHLSFWTGPNTNPGSDPGDIPEPMTLTLLASGMGALVIARKFRATN
jgi:hypothetical protein